MKNILIIILFFAFNIADAQENTRLKVEKLVQSEERAHLDKLVQLKVDYDKALYLTESRNRNDQNVEKLYETYIAYIRQIKKEPTKSNILKYIDQVLASDSNYMKNSYQYYSYIDMSLPMDRSKIISNYNYYRIVKHYLFERNVGQLPKLDDVSFIEQKAWRLPEAKDIKQ